MVKRDFMVARAAAALSLSTLLMSALGPTVELTPERFDEMKGLIKPRVGECRYLELPWVIDPGEAIRRSAQEGKPLVVCGGADGSCATGAQWAVGFGARSEAFRSYDTATLDLLKKEFILLDAGPYLCDSSFALASHIATAAGRGLDKRSHSYFPTKDAIWESLKQFKQLPEAERKPNSDKWLTWKNPLAKPPAGGLILREYNRPLYQTTQGKFELGRHEPGVDYMWLTRDESHALLPARLEKGARFPLPESVWRRIVGCQEYHFQMMGLWNSCGLSSPAFSLTVEGGSSKTIRLRLDGSVREELACLVTETRNAKIGEVDFRFLGYLEYDPQKKAWSRCDVVGLGELALQDDGCGHGRLWNDHDELNNIQSIVLGMVFELVSGERPLDQSPPKARQYGEKHYFGIE